MMLLQQFGRPIVDIVLATYQGESFVEQQVTSIQKNTGYAELVRHVYIIDDGSTDTTSAIIAQLASHDKKLRWIATPPKNVGPMYNFQRGIELTTAPLIMLCDQDDVWFENKIVDSLQEMLPYLDSTEPALVFGDMCVVDHHQEMICPSYFFHKRISKDWHCRFFQLLQQNTASGCCMMLNRALVECALPIPKQGYMHDWWFALVASAYGNIRFIDKPLMNYRQHTSNTIGAKKHSLLQRFIKRKQFVHSVQSVIEQSKAFEQHFASKLSGLTNEDKHVLAILSHLESLSFMQRVAALWTGKLTRSHWLAKFALSWVVLTKVPYRSDSGHYQPGKEPENL